MKIYGSIEKTQRKIKRNKTRLGTLMTKFKRLLNVMFDLHMH